MSSISITEYKSLYASKTKNARKSKPLRRAKPIESEVESLLVVQLKALRIEFEREFKFHQKRKWRADFYLVGTMILVEVEGGIWSGGRHTRAKGFLGDMEKYNTATMLGYQVIRFSTEQVKSGLAILQIEKMVGE